MIERRYTGIAKQGADVVANPTLDGSEANLESIGINGTNYKVGAKPFMQYFGEEITETFVMNKDRTFIFNFNPDITFPIQFINKRTNNVYQLRIDLISGGYHFGEIEYMENHNYYVTSYMLGGFDEAHYIEFEDFSLFQEGDEIEVKYYYSEISSFAEL